MGKFSSTEEVVAEDMLLVTVLAEGDNEKEFTASLLLSYIKDKKQKEFIGKKNHDVLQINTTEIFKSDYERSTFLKTKVDDLVNAPVNISIRIDAIHHIEPAELNAEFFDKAFPDSDVKDIKSLKESIKKQIELSYERDEKMLYRNKIMNQLIEHTTFELPDNFIKRFLVVNKSEEYTKENIDEKYIDIKKSISYQLIEDKISKDEAINVDNDEIRQYIKDYIRSSYFGVNNQVKLPEEQENQINSFANEMMKKTENLKNAYENIFSEKIIAALIQKVNPKIENVSFDEFLASAGDKKKVAKPKKEKSQSVKK
jgi:trigger factor